MSGNVTKKAYLQTCASSEDSDQSAYLCSLIIIFTGQIWNSQGCKVSSCWQRTLVRLRRLAGWFEPSWAHMSDGTFLHVAAHSFCYVGPTWHPVSILHKCTAGRYRPVRVADGPIIACCRFIKNASWALLCLIYLCKQCKSRWDGSSGATLFAILFLIFDWNPCLYRWTSQNSRKDESTSETKW